jgi:hypothetical protein
MTKLLPKLLLVVGGGLLLASIASLPSAKSPAPAAEEKAAASAKARKDAEAKPARRSPGADHSRPRSPDAELTRREAQNEMPKPGQANDHSTTARDPKNSSGRR